MLAALALALSITVSPAQSFAPATLNVKVKIEQAQENRFFIWSLVDETVGFETSSRWDLEGDKSPKTFFLPQWKDVPPGDYIARVAVYDASGRKVGEAFTKVRVLGQH